MEECGGELVVIALDNGNWIVGINCKLLQWRGSNCRTEVAVSIGVLLAVNNSYPASMRIHSMIRTSETPLRMDVAILPDIRGVKLHGIFKSAS